MPRIASTREGRLGTGDLGLGIHHLDPLPMGGLITMPRPTRTSAGNDRDASRHLRPANRVGSPKASIVQSADAAGYAKTSLAQSLRLTSGRRRVWQYYGGAARIKTGMCAILGKNMMCPQRFRRRARFFQKGGRKRDEDARDMTRRDRRPPASVIRGPLRPHDAPVTHRSRGDGPGDRAGQRDASDAGLPRPRRRPDRVRRCLP